MGNFTQKKKNYESKVKNWHLKCQMWSNSFCFGPTHSTIHLPTYTHIYMHVLEIRTYEWARVHRETVGFFDFANFGLKEIERFRYNTHSNNISLFMSLMLAARARVCVCICVFLSVCINIAFEKLNQTNRFGLPICFFPYLWCVRACGPWFL